MINLEKLEALAKAVTHLPWKVSDIDDRYITDSTYKRELARVSMRYRPYYERAAYIVEACNAVPELIARVRLLEKMVDYLALEFSSGDDQSDCFHTHLACQYRDGYWCHAGLEGQKQCWIRVAEQAAKEAGE